MSRGTQSFAAIPQMATMFLNTAAIPGTKPQAFLTRGTAPLSGKANCNPTHNWNLVSNKLIGRANEVGQVKHSPFSAVGASDFCCAMPQPFPSPWKCTGLVLTWEDDQHLNHHSATPGFSWSTGHPTVAQTQPKWSSHITQL